MNCSVCLFVILLGAFAFSTAEESTNSAKIQVVDNINDFLRDNPGVTLTKLDSLKTHREGYHYHFGERKPGDSLMATFRDSVSSDKPENLERTFKYPVGGGQGAVVTYVSVVLEQTSENGVAHIVSGGVGQRAVSVMVEACNSKKLSYVAEVYGQ